MAHMFTDLACQLLAFMLRALATETGESNPRKSKFTAALCRAMLEGPEKHQAIDF